jgi:RHS repeat-associated protein
MVSAGGGFEEGGAAYAYDAEGRRVRKAVSGAETTLFVYDAMGRVVAEYSNLRGGGGTSYLTQDALGSTRVITGQSNAQGQVVKERHDYLPFGEELHTDQEGYGGRSVRKKFTGYIRDNESGLDFAQARYYNPKHGRFTQIDPLTASADQVNPQTWNRYIYVSNNPLIMIDPTGEFADFYDSDGNWLGTDGKNDNKVYLVTGGGWIPPHYTDLGITHTEFQIISNIVRQEGATDDTNEYLWIAHTANNEAVATGSSLYALLRTGYSSVAPANKTALATADDSLRANAARAGIIDVLSGGADPTGGARRWDGTDFLAWGLNGPNGAHPKFRQFGTVAIPQTVFDAYVNSQGANSVRYYGTRYTIPADVFNRDTNPNNWGSWRLNGNPVSGFLYVRDRNRSILYATGTAGKSIFWTVHYYWEDK